MAYWFHQGLIHQGIHFPCVRGVWFTDLIRLVVSSGFHTPVSVLSHVSQVRGSLVSLWFHLPRNSLFRVSEVHAFGASWFHSPVSVLSCLSEVHGLLVPQGFISSEYTFPWVRGTRFSNFFRVSFNSEFTFPFVRGAWFTGSSGFHLKWVHFPMCWRYTC